MIQNTMIMTLMNQKMMKARGNLKMKKIQSMISHRSRLTKV